MAGPADPQRRHPRRQPPPAPALLVLPQRLRPARAAGRQVHGARGGQPLPRHPRQRRPGRTSSSPRRSAPLLVALGAQVTLFGPQGERRARAREALPHPQEGGGARARPAAGGDPRPRSCCRRPPAAGSRATRCASARRSTGRSPPPRWPWRWTGGTVGAGAGRPRPGGADALGRRWRPRPSSRASGSTPDVAAKAGEAAVAEGQGALAEPLQDPARPRGREAGADRRRGQLHETRKA